jgi:hypothetical protein
LKLASLFVLVFALLLLSGCLFPHRFEAPPQPVQSGELWTVQKPGVQRRVTPYPKVHFTDGDLVTVTEAGGCVNTGGVGRVWKSYVDPKGPNSAKFYRGLVWIPGATLDGRVVPVGTAPVRIGSVVGTTYVIRKGVLADSELYLRLGYEDDYYGDNGYGHWDIGKPQQCPKLRDGTTPAAFVKITVSHSTSANAGAASTAGTSQPFVFDLVATKTDQNGFMLNPHWLGQERFMSSAGEIVALPPGNTTPPFLVNADSECGGFPGDYEGFSECKCPEPTKACDCGATGKRVCTSQAPGFEYPTWFSLNNLGFGPRLKDCPNQSGGGLYGHANWVPVTMEGMLTWATDQPFDEDADIFLTKPRGDGKCEWSAYTAGWQDQIEIEAASYETFDSFWTSGWYAPFQFHRKGDVLSDQAIVTGLLGLDCVHGCKTELHPAYMIAARVKGSPVYHDGGWDDYWAIFARNHGNEGWCSHNEHPLDLSRIIVTLPPPPGATGLQSVVAEAEDSSFIHPAHKTGTEPEDDGMTEFKANIDGIQLGGPAFVDGELRLAFAFPPDKKAVVNGLLHVRWSGNQVAVPSQHTECGGNQLPVNWAPDYSHSTEKRSNQAGNSRPVAVLPYAQVAGQPMTAPIQAITWLDAANQATDKSQKALLKKHCKKDQACGEEGVVERKISSTQNQK